MAAAGGKIALRPSVAIGLLAVIAVGFLLDTLCFGRNDLTHKVPLPKPPDALVVDAREIVRLVGLEEPPADSVHWFSYNFDGQSEQLKYIEESDDSRARWDRVATIQPKPIRFFYRQSRELLLSSYGGVSQHDPPRTVPGMVEIQLQPDGSLVELLVIPPDREETDESEPETEWTDLFDRAGLAMDSLVPARPLRNPLVACDVRLAWKGTYPGQPDVPIRVEAGANRGKPVYFEILAPWDLPEEKEATEGRLGSKAATITLVVLLLVLLGVALMLARRNLLLGRGDRRGAFRMAVCYFLILWIGASLMDHHVANLRQIWYLFVNAAFSLLIACIVWAGYVALEPYVRRLWPEALIAWSRLLTGRIRDSRVGRDVMIGGVGYTVVVVLSLLLRTLRRAVDDAPPDLSTYPYLMMLDGWRGTANALGQQVLNGFTMTFLVLFFLFVLRLALRRQWAAVAGFLLLVGVMFALQSDEPTAVRALLVGGGLLYWSISILVLTRYGFLALVVMWVLVQFGIFLQLLSEFPAWYAESSLLFLAVAAGFVLYGFRISLAGRPVFRDDILEPRGSR